MRGHDLEWFVDRIGKRVYRDEGSCPCPDCKKIVIRVGY